MTAHNLTTISIPKPLFDKIKQRIEGTGFNTVSSYVMYVMRQVLSETEGKEKQTQNGFSKEDEEKVKARLKSLGYLD